MIGVLVRKSDGVWGLHGSVLKKKWYDVCTVYLEPFLKNMKSSQQTFLNTFCIFLCVLLDVFFLTVVSITCSFEFEWTKMDRCATAGRHVQES